MTRERPYRVICRGGETCSKRKCQWTFVNVENAQRILGYLRRKGGLPLFTCICETQAQVVLEGWNGTGWIEIQEENRPEENREGEAQRKMGRGRPRKLPLMERDCSNDVVNRMAVPENIPAATEPLPQVQPGGIKTTLDFSQFLVFDARTAGSAKDKIITVGTRGIIIAKEISKELPPEAKVELLLNRRGTILAMRTSDNGIPVKVGKGKAQNGQVSCSALRRELENMGVKLPAKFRTEWDPTAKAWVGRRLEEKGA